MLIWTSHASPSLASVLLSHHTTRSSAPGQRRFASRMAVPAYGTEADPSRASVASHSSSKSDGELKSQDKDITGPGITRVHDSVEVSHGPLDFLTQKFKRGHADPEDAETSSVDTDLPQGRQLGLISTVFLIVNRIVGTGVFATTSTLLAQSGSVGMSLL